MATYTLITGNRGLYEHLEQHPIRGRDWDSTCEMSASPEQADDGSVAVMDPEGNHLDLLSIRPDIQMRIKALVELNMMPRRRRSEQPTTVRPAAPQEADSGDGLAEYRGTTGNEFVQKAVPVIRTDRWMLSVARLRNLPEDHVQLVDGTTVIANIPVDPAINLMDRLCTAVSEYHARKTAPLPLEASQATPAEPKADPDEKIVYLPLGVIGHFPGGNQRTTFNQQKLEELAASIRIYGVAEPILVNESDGYHLLIAGERRLRASHMAGKPTIPARVMHLPEATALELMLVENTHREDLNPMDEARAYQRLLQLPGMKTPADVADRVGKSRVHVVEYLQLLELPADLQHQVATGALGVKSGLAFVRQTRNVPDHVKAQVAATVAAESPTTREAGRVIDRELERAGVARATRPESNKPEPPAAQPKATPPTAQPDQPRAESNPAPGPSPSAPAQSTNVRTYCFDLTLHVPGPDIKTAYRELLRRMETAGLTIGGYGDAWGKDTDESYDADKLLSMIGR